MFLLNYFVFIWDFAPQGVGGSHHVAITDFVLFVILRHKVYEDPGYVLCCFILVSLFCFVFFLFCVVVFCHSLFGFVLVCFAFDFFMSF